MAIMSSISDVQKMAILPIHLSILKMRPPAFLKYGSMVMAASSIAM